MKKFFKILILILTIISCKTEQKNKINEIISLDREKTIELLLQVFEDENDSYLSTKCITEKRVAGFDPISEDFDKYLKEHLYIKDSIHYNLQIELRNAFSMNNEIARGKSILTKLDFEEFRKNSNIDEMWELILDKCPDGYSWVSKPIFNEDFTIAYINIGSLCGGLCGGGESRIYKFKDNKWVFENSLGYWIS